MIVTWTCLDASFVLRLFFGPGDDEAWEEFNTALGKGGRMVAPSLLPYEVCNAIHRYHRSQQLSRVSAGLVPSAVEELPLLLEEDRMLRARALEIAAQLEMPAAYDAHYLAVAERYDAELWTADRALARLGRAGVARVRLF